MSLFRHNQNVPGPVLFHNITCSETHSTLFQCIHLDTIGIYNCESTAGVICPLTVISLHDSNSNHLSVAILGSVGTAVVAIGLVAVIMIVITLKMKRKRRYDSSPIRSIIEYYDWHFYRNSGRASSTLNESDIDVPMTENEAYTTVHANDTHHVKTLPNEAYGTLDYY